MLCRAVAAGMTGVERDSAYRAASATLLIRMCELTRHLATITVSFQPDLALLRQQLERLPTGALKLIVDNGSAPEVCTMLTAMVEAFDNCCLIRLGHNAGLASALNRGVEAAATMPTISHVLLLDQDTVPEAGACDALLGAHAVLEQKDPRLGAVGPALLDPQAGLQHGFHTIKGWRWVRLEPDETDTPVRCSSLNGSGTLMRRTLYEELGGLDEALFIDHVDTDWSFRLLATGHALYGVPSSRFEHRMGEHGVRLWLGRWRVWPWRSPQRHYFLFRNTVRLLRRPHVPLVWKLWAPLKLVMTAVVFGLADARRSEQWMAMLRGLRDGRH